MSYTPPNYKELTFKFKSGVYTSPDLDNLVFNFTSRPSYIGSSYLGAYIDAHLIYNKSTFTYLKECKKIITGYSRYGVQTLQLPCVYGGIRDLVANISLEWESSYLSAYISGLEIEIYLNAFIRTSFFGGNLDLRSFARSIENKSSISLTTFIRFISGKDIIQDLYTEMLSVEPKDLYTQINIIELRSIIANITGELYKGNLFLNADIYKVFLRDVSSIVTANLYGWADRFLNASIAAVFILDLKVNLYGRYIGLSDILTYILPIEAVNLNANLHGYDYKYLNATLLPKLNKSFLVGIIGTIPFTSLDCYIKGYRGVSSIKNLNVYISSYMSMDLNGYIATIEFKQLKAYIDAIGKYKDLSAWIIPSVIHVKRVLQISLLQKKDLYAMVNYNCLKSGYIELFTTMHVLMKSDLTAYISGWFGDYSRNTRFLNAYININNYKVINEIELEFLCQHRDQIQLDVSAGNMNVKKFVFDTISFDNSLAMKLDGWITGVLESSDLSAYLVGQPYPNFTTIPSWIDMKHREVVINLNRFEERIKRFVELTFETGKASAFNYFYIDGDEKVYKSDKNRTWKIKLEGYNYNQEDFMKKSNINTKYIYRLKNFTTIDEHIRDIIDKLSLYRNRYLYAYIQSINPIKKDLFASIKCKVVTKWVSKFSASIYPKQYRNLNAYITAL